MKRGPSGRNSLRRRRAVAATRRLVFFFFFFFGRPWSAFGAAFCAGFPLALPRLRRFQPGMTGGATLPAKTAALNRISTVNNSRPPQQHREGGATPPSPDPAIVEKFPRREPMIGPNPGPERSTGRSPRRGRGARQESRGRKDIRTNGDDRSRADGKNSEKRTTTTEADRTFRRGAGGPGPRRRGRGEDRRGGFRSGVQGSGCAAARAITS